MWPAIIVGSLAAASAVAYAMHWWRRNVTSAMDEYYSNRQQMLGDYRDELDQMAANAERRRQEKKAAKKLVKELLEAGDPQMANLLADEAGVALGSPQEAWRDDDLIRRIAERVDLPTLSVFRSALRTSTQLDAIELEATHEYRETPYPADRFEVRPLVSDAGLDQILPDQLAASDDVFFAALGNDELQVTQNLEHVQLAKRIYILVDVSGSMEEKMYDGTMRILWAAGVALKLMMRALAGEAEFLLRFFGSVPHERHEVRTPEQARQMAQTLLRLRDWGEGTDIQYALQVAVDDIKSSSSVDIETSDVLLISDGESNIDGEWMAATFGDSVRLHVAMIGRENTLLKSHATSYYVYR